MTARLRLMLAGVLAMCVVSAVEGDGGWERFLEVKQWKGEIGLRIEDNYAYQHSDDAGYYRERIHSVESWQYRLHTGDGMEQMIDHFATEAGRAETPAGAGGMPGMDMGRIREAMKQSGMDPAMMNMVLGEMNRLNRQGMSLSGSYKKWHHTGVPAGMQLDSSGGVRPGPSMHYRLRSIREVTDNGLDPLVWCEHEERHSYSADIDGNASLNLLINLEKKAYSFKWQVLEQPETWKEHAFRIQDSCEDDLNRDGTESHPVDMGPPRIDIPGQPDNSTLQITLEPLPETGLVLSGSRSFVMSIPNEADRDRPDTRRKVELHWRLVPAD